MSASKLIKDLEHVPEIIASLGLSIADAQHALNVDYLHSMERVIAMIRSLLPDAKLAENPDFRTFLQELLKQLSPSRYQFTETTLTVRLNLAQRLDLSTQAGLGIGVGAVSVNAAFALAYGFDYQAAAECRTTLHAYPADGNVMEKLLGRAEKLSDKALELSEKQRPHEKALIDGAAGIFKQLTGEAPAKEVKAPAAG